MKDAKTQAAAYYTALGNKNIEAVKEYIHPNIEFTDPQETLVGREAFLEAAKKFSAIFKTLTIHAKFGSDDEAVIVYDVEIPFLGKNLRAVSLLHFEDGLIAKIELIYNMGSLVAQ